MHKKDDAAVPGWDPEDHPRSVLSARTNEDIAEGRPGRWPAATADELAALRKLPSAKGRAVPEVAASGRRGSPSRSPTSTRC